MAFLEEPRFPECIKLGFRGGPGFDTTIVTVNSGHESRNLPNANPLAKFDAAQAIKRQSEFEQFLDFWHVMEGPTHGFRVKNWFDFECSITQGQMLPVNGSATVFQLYKVRTVGSWTRGKKIQKPRLAVGLQTFTTLYKDGVQLTYGVGAGQVVFDESKGLVTFNTAPGASVLSWAGEYDTPCRFDIKEFSGVVENKTPDGELLMSWNEIPITEIRIR